AELARAGEVEYRPVDLSAAALLRCRRELRDLPGVAVSEIRDEFLPGLRAASRERAPGQPLLVLFLGSTIGSFEREEAVEFRRELRATLRAGDALLLGTDLVQPAEVLRAAYDDAAGVTAAFDLNLLARLNRELGAGFELHRFAHEARWDAEARR